MVLVLSELPGPASTGGYGGTASTAVTDGWLAGGGGGGGNATELGGAGGGWRVENSQFTGGGTGAATTGDGGSGIVIVRYQIAQMVLQKQVVVLLVSITIKLFIPSQVQVVSQLIIMVEIHC